MNFAVLCTTFLPKSLIGTFPKFQPLISILHHRFISNSDYITQELTPRLRHLMQRFCCCCCLGCPLSTLEDVGLNTGSASNSNSLLMCILAGRRGSSSSRVWPPMWGHSLTASLLDLAWANCGNCKYLHPSVSLACKEITRLLKQITKLQLPSTT